MNTIQLKHLSYSVLLRYGWRSVVFLVFVTLLPLVMSCSDDDNVYDLPVLNAKSRRITNLVPLC